MFANLLNTLGIRRVDLGREGVTAQTMFGTRNSRSATSSVEGCAEKIAGALTSMPEVRDVRPTVPQKRIRVRYDPGKVREQQLKDALSNIGFTALDA